MTEKQYAERYSTLERKVDLLIALAIAEADAHGPCCCDSVEEHEAGKCEVGQCWGQYYAVLKILRSLNIAPVGVVGPTGEDNE